MDKFTGLRAEFIVDTSLVVARIQTAVGDEILGPCPFKHKRGDRMTILFERLNANAYVVDTDRCKQHLHVTMAVHVRTLDVL
jgi:hypothetical protein